jgi:TolB-like protein
MAEKRIQRRLAAILAADVVGFSRMMGVDEAGTLAALKSRRRDVLDPLVARHQGRIFKTTGDGVLVEFGSAVNAVQCAVALQEGMAKANANQPEDRYIVLRVAVNLGDVMVEGSDLYGDGINIAARLEPLAEPGGVLVSGAAYDHIKSKVKIGFEELGLQTLKNIVEPVRAYRVTGKLAVATAAPKPVDDKPSIAVLPFDNMSGDPEQGYFADGITEDIITGLSRFRELLVIARNSSFQFRGGVFDIKDVAQKLRVKFVVEGSIRKIGNKVRVTVQLIDTGSGAHIWAERYDRDLTDIFGVQDEVVASIVVQLGLNIREVATAHAGGRPTKSLTAYDHFLRGRAAWWHGKTKEGFAFLNKALEADPDFAAAHAWLAVQYTYQLFSGTMGLSQEEVARKNCAHAEAALALDPRDPLVHSAASMTFGFSPWGNKDRALHHSNTAVALNPHDSDIAYFRAYVLLYHGRHQEALDWLEKVRNLNPISQQMLAECLVDVLYMTGDYEKSLGVYRELSFFPQQVPITFAACHAQLGRIDEARACVAEMERTLPTGFVVSLAKTVVAICVREEDGERWREGFRKAGIPI